MNQNKERIQILSYVRHGELDIPEAITRLQAISARVEIVGTERELNQSARELRVVRTEAETGKLLMDIRLPIELLDAAKRVGAEICPILAIIPQDILEDAMTKPGTQKLIDVQGSEHGGRLEIYLE